MFTARFRHDALLSDAWLDNLQPLEFSWLEADTLESNKRLSIFFSLSNAVCLGCHVRISPCDAPALLVTLTDYNTVLLHLYKTFGKR